MCMIDQQPLNHWQMQILDREQVNAEKGWQQTADLSPADRIALIEHLRMMWHGQAEINARVPRVC